MRWSKEKAWEWYDSRPWMRGCNYMSADCANRVDQWQELGFEERFKTAQEEMALVKETGFNTVRLIPEYVVWKEEHDGFMERFERYISLCAQYGQSVMIVLASDCMPPMSEDWKLPAIGVQHYDWGYHGGRKKSQHGPHEGPAPHFYLDDPVTREEYFDMIRDIVTTYKDDPRICIWDLYNEPGASKRYDITVPNLKRIFEIVREIDPIQPLTVGMLRVPPDENIPLLPPDQYALENVDIISYHFYKDFNSHVRIIKRLKKEGRPIICSEWLCRCTKNDVFTCFPLFYLEKIGCYNWGFVAGKYQTYEPWENTWYNYYNGTNTDVDFTKWFHDLYRPSLRPYDPKEIDLIKSFCKLADEDFEKENK